MICPNPNCERKISTRSDDSTSFNNQQMWSLSALSAFLAAFLLLALQHHQVDGFMTTPRSVLARHSTVGLSFLSKNELIIPASTRSTREPVRSLSMQLGRVTMYKKNGCPYCARAIELLEGKYQLKVDYVDIESEKRFVIA